MQAQVPIEISAGPKKFPCLCQEEDPAKMCDFASWPVGLKTIQGTGYLFIFKKDEDGLHELMTVRNEWLPKLKEALG